MQSEIPPYVFVIFIGATAAGVLLQAAILLGMFIALKKTQKKVEDMIDEARVHLLPTIVSSRILVDDLAPKLTSAVNDLTPKLKVISTNLVETTSLIRREAENVKGVVDEVVGRTRGQAARVDGMVTGTLNGVEHATTTIQNGVAIPIKKISGWVAAAQAGLGVLFQKRAKNGYPASTYKDSSESFVTEPEPTSYTYPKPATVSTPAVPTKDHLA
jgi:methyl-accepting chemotaxis protein